MGAAFSEVEVNRLGSFGQTEKASQNTAIRNAVKHFQHHQTPGGSVERITIMGNEPAGSSFSQGQSGQANRPTSYRVWVKVAGCDRDIMYTANSNGSLTSYTDDGECLSGARGRGGGDSTGEAAPRGAGGQSF